MTALIAGCLVGCAAVLLLHLTWTQSRLRWMARHPAPTFLFADLVGYTALTERCGDEAGARVAREFRRAMSALSREHGARQVKSMGDGAMIWAPDAGRAVTLAARTVLEIGTRPDLLPVRVGAHTGPALMRDGDWYGSSVNLAARLARAAGPNEALISITTQSAAHQLESALKSRCELVLRGVERPMVAWRVAVDATRRKDRGVLHVLAGRRGSRASNDLGPW
jgi:class 3 adenylate cyclase